MTPLEQFNEEVMREFQDEFKQMFEDLSEDKELYFKHVFNNFITHVMSKHIIYIFEIININKNDCKFII